MTTELDEANYRLPRTARPVRYALRLAPNLEAAKFSGEESLELEIVEPCDTVVMNACDLAIDTATIATGWESESNGLGDSVRARFSFDSELERVSFAFPTTLPVGRYTFHATFRGELNDKLIGFYRSTFTDEQGVSHTIATTQFEQTDARKAFPCFDEPDRKAIFAVTLDVPNEMAAVSNGPEVEVIDLGDGTRRVRYGETIPMSTYLVAFVIGPLVATDPIDVDGITLRVYTVPGKVHLAQHALDSGAHALRFFAHYFDIPYPGEKLDLLALPDFASGAMENLGCVTFREAILLADPENASRSELERLAEVVEHEIAHMWFGDLVTMSWWNGIWLNEAFATFMALCAQDDYRPEWDSFVSFSRSKAAAFQVDALHSTRSIEVPVRHPDEAAAMFDVLTYEKGASVLWMIEQFLGREQFRAGVRRYLKAHLYGNTETGDLWDAIEHEAGDVPIRKMMDSWIFQGGFPLLVANRGTKERGSVVTLTQEPFSYLPVDDGRDSMIGHDWLVPVVAGAVGDPGSTSRVVVADKAIAVTATSGPMLINVGGSGFFRVHYDDATYTQLLDQIAELSGVERFNLVADTWALVLAGKADLSRLVELTNALASERDPYVWSTVIGAIGLIDLVAPTTSRDELAIFTRSLLTPLLTETGWEARSKDDEQTPLLRSSLIATLGTIGDDNDVVQHCHELFLSDHQGSQPIPADLTAAVLSVVASRADGADFAMILERFRQPFNPNDQLRHLNAFAQLGDVALATKVHEMCLDEIRSQDAPYLLGAMLRNRAIGPVTWTFITKHFNKLIERIPENSVHRMLEGASALAQLDDQGNAVLADEIEEFCNKNIVGARRQLLERTLERLTINVRFAGHLKNGLAVLTS
jgi:puromycin-sensitive aminopeptidase